MAKLKKTYRLDEETVAAIAAIAERDGMTATEVIEVAVRDFDGGSESVRQPKPDGYEDAVTANAAAIAALAAQLSAKDAQIEALSASLASAQQLADQAQRLQASALPPVEDRQVVSVPLKPPRLTLRERITGRVSR